MFFLIDKPIGISSFELLKQLRKKLNIKKIGHGGTLDPLATGCILVATEKSTKLLSLFDHSEKEYIFTVRLDGTTESLDAGTPIHSVKYIPIEKSFTEIEDFISSQKEQIPPKYSALHIDGVRAYSLARSGIDFEIEKRPIEVKNVRVIEIDNLSISISLKISSGGYIRSFAPILWTFLWSGWGYVSELRRTAIHTKYGSWREKDTSKWEKPVSISYESIFPDILHKEMNEQEYEAIKLGKEIISEEIWLKEWLIFLNFKNEYTSLCKYKDHKFTIVKNDVK